MSILQNYTFFLFDFDGLLVNTEELHYLAYKRMLKAQGCTLTWDFPTYFSIAEQSSKILQERIYQEFPSLSSFGWDVLYKQKKEALIEVLHEKGAPLMPGAYALLESLQKLDKKRCVVTHSPRALIEVILKQNPILTTIEHWFCREDYTHAKPHPDGYLTAIKSLAQESDRCIGFEDSKRGMEALMQTAITPVFVNATNNAARQEFIRTGIFAFENLDSITHSN